MQAAALRARKYWETPSRKSERPAQRRKQRTRAASPPRRRPSPAGMAAAATPPPARGFQTSIARGSLQPPKVAAIARVTGANNGKLTTATRIYRRVRMRRPAQAGLDDHQIPTDLLVRMQCAFAAHLICGIGHGVRIEALPARPAVKLPAFPEIHGGLVHHRFDPRQFGLRHPSGDPRSNPAPEREN